jgi:hypothetical protein
MPYRRRDVPPSDLVVEREAVTEAELAGLGVNIAEQFPGASISEFRRYPVLTEGGWHIVIKHQPTLTSVARERWDLLGPIKLASDGLEI